MDVNRDGFDHVAYSEIKQRVQQSGVVTQNPDISPEPESLGQQFKQDIVTPVAGAAMGLTESGRTIQNLLSKGVDKIFGTKGFGSAGTREEAMSQMGLDPESTQAKIGAGFGEATSLIAGPQAKGTFLAKLPQQFAKTFAIASANTGSFEKGRDIALTEAAFSVAGKALQKTGSVIYKNLAIPMSKKEAVYTQAWKAKNSFASRVLGFADDTRPVTADDTALRKGFMGTESGIGIQAARAKSKLWGDVIDPALKQADEIASVDKSQFFDDARTLITETTPDLTRQKQLLKALDGIADDYAQVDSFSISKMQDLKSGWTKFLPEKSFRGEDITAATREVQKVLSDQARGIIHQTIDDPTITRAYIDYGNLEGLTKWGQTAMTGGKFKGGTGGFITALKDAVLTPIATISGQTLYQTGNGIQFVAPGAANSLYDLLTSEYQPPIDQSQQEELP